MSEPSRISVSPNRRLITACMVVITLVAFASSAWAPGPTTEKYDENLWLQRSSVFSNAIIHGDFSRASAADPSLGLVNPTMPGVTTMWAGVLGRQLARASGALGLSAAVRGPSGQSPQVLRASQTIISAWWALLLALMMVLARKLFGTRVALMSGALIAIEPWPAGLAHLLHTDALVTLFTMTSLLALAVALNADRRAPHEAVPAPKIGWIIVAGALAAGGLLTKTNAIGILGPGMALIAWDAWRHRYRGRVRELWRVAAVGLGIVAIVSAVAWPALVTAPADQVRFMLHASENVGRVRLRWFHGRLRAFIPQFYVVALVFRLTPWMLLWCATGFVAGVVDLVGRLRARHTVDAYRSIPLWLIATPSIYLAALSLSRFGYDRYALALVPFGAIAGAIAVARWLPRIGVIHRCSPAMLASIGLVLCLAGAVVPMRAAPYGTEFADPLLGGQRAAVRWIPVEGGQASAELSQVLADHVHGRCDAIRVVDAYWHPASDRCGHYFAPRTTRELAAGDYAIIFDVNAQGVAREWYRPWLVRHAELLATERVGGVALAELWRIPHHES